MYETWGRLTPPHECYFHYDAVTELGRLGITVDCAPAKLIQGWGRNVVEILDALADKVCLPSVHLVAVDICHMSDGIVCDDWE